MSTNQDHVILRSRIEVTMDTASQNQALYGSIYKTIQQQLLPLLSKLFSQYAPSDIVVHLDKLVIDGGSLDISVDALPYAIEERLIHRLKQVLNRVIQNPISGQVVPLTEAKRDAVAHYLSEGHFAWWMVERSEEQIETLYLTLLNEHPQLIEAFWFNLAKKEIAVQRCIRIFRQLTLERTLACLLKQPIASFVSIISETALALDQSAILSSSPYRPEQQLVGMALLATLTQQKCSLDRMDFLHMLLKQVATTTSISYEKILQKLHIHYVKHSNELASTQTIQPFLRQLYDIAIIPPKRYHEDIKNQEKILKALDTIGGRISMDTYQLSEAIKFIQVAVEQPGTCLLVKSWLKEASNREKLVKYLPEQLFVDFLQSMEPSIVALFADATKIIRATATTIAPASDLKLSTLAYCAFRHSKKKYVEELKALFRKNFDKGCINQKKLVIHIDSQMATKDLSNKILDTNRFLFDKSDIIYYTSHSDQEVLVANKTDSLHLSNVVNFLLYNELPKDELVPAYVIAKSLAQATPKEIYEQLAPWCQESTILKKLIEHATESTLSKLIESFVAAGYELLDNLVKVMMQSSLFRDKQKHTTLRWIQEISIAAAISCRPSASQKQYLTCVLFHLSNQFGSKPTILCQELIDGAKEVKNGYLVEVLSLVQENVGPFDLDKLDEIDLVLLAIEEKLPLDQSCLPIYHHSLLLAIKNIILQADVGTLSQAAIHKLVVYHLPTLGKTLQKEISLMLYKEITHSIPSKKEQVAQRWKLFLHTGKLGNYPDATHLLNDVLTTYLPTFSLAKATIHVRQRLVTNFTHTQLMLLVAQQTHMNQSLSNCIEGTYQLWCATQGVLGQQNTTKNLFWNSLLKALPSKPIATDDWLSQIITTLSNVLAISSTTLLESFQLLIPGTNNIPVVKEFTKALDRLQKKYQTNMQQEAMQRGYTEPILRKLHLLFHSNLSTFSRKYALSLDALSGELVAFISAEPLSFLKFLQDQGYNPFISRRIVHYFDQSVTAKIITCLAQENSLFVNHYFVLLTSPLGHTDSTSTWHKELSIAIIDYLTTKTYFRANLFIAHTLSHTIYPRADKWQIIASIVSTPAITDLDTQIITLLKPLLKRINQPTDVAILADQSKIVEHLPAKKDRFSEDTVRIYTKNSGLVFIWPFLYNFFKKHNLMVGNQFLSAQAAHNAVYLLQHLVTGKLKSPEWQLTLPKLLCGLPYDVVLLPYKPIDKSYDLPQKGIEEEAIGSQSEAIQSQRLFQSVLKRWKQVESLQAIDPYQQATTQAILQDYFLNRLGILTRHAVDDEGQEWLWHLMMMRQEHDHTIDLLPPWSMNRVKLPWMQEAIVLFWAGS